MEQAKPRKRRDSRDHSNDARVTERDIALFKLLDPFNAFKFLTSVWLHRFVGGNETAFKHRLRKLYDNAFLDRDPEQKHTENFDYKHTVYSLGPAGKRALEKVGYVCRPATHRSREYSHEFLVDTGFYAPMRAAAEEQQGFSVLTVSDLLAHDNVPKETRESREPLVVKLDNDKVTLDGAPVLLKRTVRGEQRVICIPGIQVERGTKGVRVKDLTRSSVGKHLRHAVEAKESNAYRRHFGFDNMILPFIFTSETQTALAMDYLKEFRPRGCAYIVFKTIPDLAYQRHFPKPSSDFFTSPWLRVGHAPFVFNEEAFG